MLVFPKLSTLLDVHKITYNNIIKKVVHQPCVEEHVAEKPPNLFPEPRVEYERAVDQLVREAEPVVVSGRIVDVKGNLNRW